MRTLFIGIGFALFCRATYAVGWHYDGSGVVLYPNGYLTPEETGYIAPGVETTREDEEIMEQVRDLRKKLEKQFQHVDNREVVPRNRPVG